MTLEELEALQPEVAWRTPVKIWNVQAQAWRYMCRVCLNIGSKLEAQAQYDSPHDIARHQTSAHGKP